MDFAILTSANRQTSHAMQGVLDKIAGQNANSEHHRKFIREHAKDLASTKSPTISQEPGFTSDFTTEADESEDEEEIPSEAPCYVLSFREDASPFQFDVGFRFVSGDLERPFAGVDLLLPAADLASSKTAGSSELLRSSSRTAPHPRQGYFGFDPTFGWFWLHARHGGIRVDDRPIPPRGKELLRARERISIGPYRFIFEFKVSNEMEFQASKKQYYARHLRETHIHESTSVTLSSNDVRIQDLVLHGIVGAGAFSVVHAASNVRSGEAVAVKRFHIRWAQNAGSSEPALYDQILHSIRGHRYSEFVMRKHSLLADDRPFVTQREIYMLCTPLALGDFVQFGINGRWYKESLETKKILFVQVFLGLSALHDCGWIHRDVKPANLGVVSLEAPFAIILDKGAAVRQVPNGHEPKAGVVGTIGYLAPELENGHVAATYGKAVDVWSMGAVAYFLFEAGKIPWSRTSNMFLPQPNFSEPSLDDFRKIQGRLLGEPKHTLSFLVGAMMIEDPRDRWTLKEILAHPELRSVRSMIDAKQDADKSTERKRARIDL